MVRYIGIIFFLLLINSTPIFADAEYNGNSIGTVKKYVDASWQTISAKKYISSSWQTILGMIYHFFVAAGQSNAQGYGNYTLSPVADGIEIKWNGDVENEISDPVGYGIVSENTFASADTGSLWPSFAAEYYELTGHKVILLSLCRGATGQCIGADSGDGYWSMSLYNSAKSEVDDAITQLNSLNISYEYKGWVWYQGENDEFLGITGAAYITCAQQMFDQMITDYPGITVQVIQIGDGWGADIQPAQVTLCNSRDFLYLTTKEDPAQNPHLTQAQYNSLGERVAEDIADRLE
jgi:hypothetical protein